MTATAQNREIRYAIQIHLNGTSRPVYLSRTDTTSRFVEDARTWKTEKGAERWVAERPEWEAFYARKGAVSVVKVVMGRRVKSAPVALA